MLLEVHCHPCQDAAREEIHAGYGGLILRCHEFTMQDKLDGHHKSALLLVALGLVMIGKLTRNKLEPASKCTVPFCAQFCSVFSWCREAGGHGENTSIKEVFSACAWLSAAEERQIFTTMYQTLELCELTPHDIRLRKIDFLVTNTCPSPNNDVYTLP